jgi:hypothetical protein
VIYWDIISCNSLVSGKIFSALKIKWVPPKRSTRLSGQTTAVQRKRIFLVLRLKKYIVSDKVGDKIVECIDIFAIISIMCHAFISERDLFWDYERC